MTTNTNPTAAELRAKAAAARKASADSWERSDTDGFLSQWASDLTARQYDLEADIVEAGGRASFPALFDLDGNLVAAKMVESRYGLSWGLLENDDPRSRFTGFFNESQAATAAARNRNNRKKGYTVGWVLAPARATLAGKTTVYARAERTDGGFSRDVEVVSTTETDD